MTGSLKYSDPGRPLSITNYFLLGGQPEPVKKMYEQSSHYKMLYALAACHKNIEEYERYVMSERRQTGRWPEKVFIYAVGESVRGALDFPLALASILAEAVTLASGEEVDKKALKPAVDGIAYEIYKEADRRRDTKRGGELVAARILYEIEYTVSSQQKYTAPIIARIMFLREVVKDLEGVIQVASWI